MIFKWPTYPTKWRWRFALIPVYFGNRQWLWFEFYQIRQTGPGSWERKRRDGAVVELSYYY